MPAKKFSLALTLGLAGFFTAFLSETPAAAQTETLLHTFTTARTDGATPRAGLIFDDAGNLYGTTCKGGSDNAGTIYELTPNGSGGWNFSLLYSFSPKPKYNIDEISGLTFDKAGNVYGTTSIGGDFNNGRIFELSPQAGGAWSETVLHNFQQNGKDGFYPTGGVTIDSLGNLYGTSYYGGMGTCQFDSCGVVYELAFKAGHWVEQILYNFQNNGTDGSYPNSGVVFDTEGNLYGTTAGGGTYGDGAVYELSRAEGGGWTERTVHSFGATGDTGFPSGLIFNGGNLYGATADGGTFAGNVYRLTPTGGGAWSEQILYSFPYNFGGGTPQLPGGIAMDSAGNIYGIGVEGGANLDGAVFELSPQSGTYSETTLYNFVGAPNGASPAGNLTVDSHGNVYGVTQYGGTITVGTVYEVTP